MIHIINESTNPYFNLALEKFSRNGSGSGIISFVEHPGGDRG